MFRIEKWCYGVLALALFGYVVTRDILNPLVSDEAYSFLYFIFPSRFLPFAEPGWSANNHFLNSLLSWCSYQFFGPQEWALRLPNLIAFLLFLFFNYKIGRQIKSPLLRWLYWICLLSTQYLLEFFSYSRGYGLSIAFLAGGLWFLNQAIRQQKILRDWQSWLFMWLAVAANLNMLSSYLIWLLFVAFFTLKNLPIKKWLFPFFLRAVTVIPFVLLGFQLKQNNELYFGTSKGLGESIHLLLIRIFRQPFDGAAYIVMFLFFLILLGMVAHYKIFMKPGHPPLPFFILGSFLILNILIALIQFYILDINLPVERAIIHWFFLCIASLFLELDFLSEKYHPSFAWAGLPLLILPFSQLSQYNLYSATSPEWKEQQFSQRFYNSILEIQSQSDHLLRLESSILFNKHVYDYLNLKNHNRLNDLQFVDSLYADSKADIILTHSRKANAYRDHFRTLATDTHNKTVLLQRKQGVAKKLRHRQNLTKPPDAERQYFQLMSFSSDSLGNKDLLISVSLEITTPDNPKTLYTTIRLRDYDGQIVKDEGIDMISFKENWQKKDLIQFSYTLYSVPEKASSLEVFIWNNDKPLINLSSARTEVFELD